MISFIWEFNLCLVSFGGLGRIGEVKRVTKETNVWVKINLDGTGTANSDTSIRFLDHMLDVWLFLYIFRCKFVVLLSSYSAKLNSDRFFY